MKSLGRSTGSKQLEVQKLQMEIDELRHWWKRPSYLQAIFSLIIAIATTVAASLSGWFNYQIKTLEIRKDTAQIDLSNVQGQLQSARNDLQRLRTDNEGLEATKRGLQAKLENAQIRIASEIKQRTQLSRMGVPASEQLRAAVEMSKSVEQSLIRIQNAIRPTANPVLNTSVANPYSGPPILSNVGRVSQPNSSSSNSSQQVKGELYDEMRRVQERIAMLNGEWEWDLQTASIDAALPYKAGQLHGPMPDTMPRNLSERLDRQNAELMKRYQTMAPEIRTIRDKAIPYIKMTAAEETQDTQDFHNAELAAKNCIAARKLEHHTRIQHPVQEDGRLPQEADDTPFGHLWQLTTMGVSRGIHRSLQNQLKIYFLSHQWSCLYPTVSIATSIDRIKASKAARSPAKQPGASSCLKFHTSL